MMRCHVCGRSLVGLRADHPLHCRIEALIRGRAIPILKLNTGAPGRALVTAPGHAEAVVEAAELEAEGMNPGTYRRQIRIFEGPVQRGITKIQIRRAS